jgi:hypothetical protein
MLIFIVTKLGLMSLTTLQTGGRHPELSISSDRGNLPSELARPDALFY